MEPYFRKLSENFWVGDASFPILGADLGNRMTVIRIESSQEVMVISPNRLTSQIEAELKSLGNIRYFIAPNLHHNLFFDEYKKAFPAAVFYASPRLFETSVKFKFDLPLKASDMPWSDDVDGIGIEGAPKVDEFVFYHKPSQSVVLTDIAMHFPHARNGWEKFWYKLIGAYQRLHITLFLRTMVKDKSLFMASVDKILQLPIKRIVVSHGEILEGQNLGHVLRKAFPY